MHHVGYYGPLVWTSSSVSISSGPSRVCMLAHNLALLMQDFSVDLVYL